ncbi:MAG: heme-binding protein [Alphaproteobacteria bacterium]
MNRKQLWWTAAGIGGSLALGAVLWGPIASQVERARYKVVHRKRNIEIRDYTPMIVAETEISGDREHAIRQGFRTLADYIFGDNTASRVIAMRAAVTQQPGGQPSSEKIAMTAPVTQQPENGFWLVRFVMPARYTTDTLPRPNNPAVMLRHLEAKRFAAIRFSGVARDTGLQRHTKRLESFIRDKGLRPLSPPAFAFYNPPWTLPFLRRNEVMIEIAQQ